MISVPDGSPPVAGVGLLGQAIPARPEAENNSGNAGHGHKYKTLLDFMYARNLTAARTTRGSSHAS